MFKINQRKSHSCITLFLGLLGCATWSLLLPAASFASSGKKVVYAKNGSGIQVIGDGTSVHISTPRGWRDAPAANKKPIIVGTFKTINKNFISQFRGIKILTFKADGTYEFRESGKLTSSGLYRVGVDPLRKIGRDVAVLESSNPMWVRIDSKDRVNYQFMNYDRIK